MLLKFSRYYVHLTNLSDQRLVIVEIVSYLLDKDGGYIFW